MRNTKKKHTPGPWYAWDNGSVSAGLLMGSFIGHLKTPTDENREEMNANARLIAAAPDLLIAAKHMFERVSALREQMGMFDLDGEADYEALRDAIAKAEGDVCLQDP